MATPTAASLRCARDRELSEELLADSFVQKAIEHLERDTKESPLGVRRQLLATSLRLTPSMMPDVHATIAACRERLGIEIPLEVYVYASADFNAAAVKPEEGRLFILLSSSLLESFREQERRFVIGHELGHHLYDHHAIPVGYVLRGAQPPPGLALKLFAWSRYAEISADRAGAWCAPEPDDVARALFRLSSGLRRPLEDVRIDEFLGQIEDLQLEHDEPGQGAPQHDWVATHPFSPLRLEALRFYFSSELAGGQDPVDRLELRVQELMALMEPSYLEEKTEEAEIARRLLFAGAIAVARANGEVGEKEVAAFEELFGAGSFKAGLDLDAIEAALDERIAAARERVGSVRRIQLVRDLSIIARADGRVSTEEQAVIERIAGALEVPQRIVEERFCSACELH